MYSIRNYGEMIVDAPRMDAYSRALRQVITPGCVVADIGAGTGIFALLACRLGARRVYAIEPGPAIALAREMAAANGYADRIDFFEAASAEVELPGRADVIVSDLRGILPFFQRHIPSIVDARDRFLAPGGVLIPRRDTLWCALTHAELHDSLTAPWTGNAFGLDMRAATHVLANGFYRLNPAAQRLASVACRIGEIDYQTIMDADFRTQATLRPAGACEANGLVVWFDSILADGVGLSNAPGSPPLIYGNAFFPWPERIALQNGDEVHVELRADLVGPDYVWTWGTRIAAEGGGARAQFRQSEFFGEWLPRETLSRRGADHVPALGEEGRIERFVLDRMEAGIKLANIAHELVTCHPGRFRNWEAALAHVGEISARFGA